jgi:diphthine synthase
LNWLAFVGLGLSAEKGLTLRAAEVLRLSDLVYLEDYTSLIPGFDSTKLSALIGKKIREVTRFNLEDESGAEILDNAVKTTVSFAVPGDPFIATTHIYLRNEAQKKGIPVLYIPGVSVYSAAYSLAGLQVYKSGSSATIVEPSLLYRPKTQYEKAFTNLAGGMHTFFFLDINKTEGKLMSFSRAAKLLEAGLAEFGIETNNIIGVGLGQVGSEKQFARAASLRDLQFIHDNNFPHCLILPGKLDDVEAKALMFLGADQKLIDGHAKTIERISRKIYF